MLIRRFDLDEFSPIDEYSYRHLYPWEGVIETPFYSGWTHLAPGQRTKKHQHHELETYFIAYGKGELRWDEEKIQVKAGDVVYMPPFHYHLLTNDSEEDLLFLSIAWEDMSTLRERKAPEAGAGEGDRVLVIAPGQAAESEPEKAAARRAAQAHAAFLRLRGAEVLLIDGEEGNGAVAGQARALLEALEGAGRLHRRPDDQGRQRLWLPLAELVSPVRDYQTLAATISPRVRGACERFFDHGVGDLAVSVPGDAGLSVPVPGFEGQVLTPEIATVAAYLATTEEDGWGEIWRGEESRAVTFFPVADASFYAWTLPAILLARNEAETQPPRFLIDLQPTPAREGSASDDERATSDEWWRFYAAAADGELTGAGPESLRQRLGDWLAALGRKLSMEQDGQVPATGMWTPEQHRYHDSLARLMEEATAAYEARTFSLPTVWRLLEGAVASVRRFARSEDHWVGLPGRRDERRTSLALELLTARQIAVMASPVLPVFAARVWADLGYEPGEMSWQPVPDWVPPGRRIESFDQAVKAC